MVKINNIENTEKKNYIFCLINKGLKFPDLVSISVDIPPPPSDACGKMRFKNVH